MSTPAFSILLPTNVDSPLLQAAVRSVQRAVEGSRDCEVIVVLDGIERISALPHVGRHTVITVSPGQGISAALNWGTRSATGDYIVRMDGDDLCHPTRFHDLRRLFVSEPDIIAGAIVKFGACRSRYEAPPRTAHQVMEDLFHRGYAFAHPAAAVRRDVLVAAGGYRSEFDGCEDLDLWLRMLQSGATFARSSSPHIWYRVHHSQASRSRAAGDRLLRRLILVPNASRPCSKRCPGRLATYLALRSGDRASVCPDYLPYMRLRDLRRAAAVDRVSCSHAALRRITSILGQELRARWELARAGR
jgi:glycosyltransferase involved in cell wall biosynthesis